MRAAVVAASPTIDPDDGPHRACALEEPLHLPGGHDHPLPAREPAAELRRVLLRVLLEGGERERVGLGGLGGEEAVNEVPLEVRGGRRSPASADRCSSRTPVRAAELLHEASILILDLADGEMTRAAPGP